MKQILIDELKKFFNFKEKDNLETLEKDSKIRAVNGLSTLIKYLNNQSASPKEIFQQVEYVIVCISLKNKKATDLERSLRGILVAYQEKVENGDIEFEDKSDTYHSTRQNLI